MKKIIFLLAIIASFTSYGQVSVGLNGGILIAANQYDAKYPSPHSAFKTGAEVLVKLSDKWILKTGIDYSSFTFKREFQYTDQTGAKLGVTSEFYTASYIGVPVGIRYQFKGVKINPFIEASVSGMVKASDKSKIENAPPFGYSGMILQANTFIVSPSLGAGLTYHPTDHIYLSFLVNYNMQLMPVYDYNNTKYNSIGAILSFGYQF